jgi:hypothetical protein
MCSSEINLLNMHAFVRRCVCSLTCVSRYKLIGLSLFSRTMEDSSGEKIKQCSLLSFVKKSNNSAIIKS